VRYEYGEEKKWERAELDRNALSKGGRGGCRKN
jgi:hypothetical protein